MRLEQSEDTTYVRRSPPTSRRDKKRVTDRFGRRNRGLFKKGHALATLCNVKVFIATFYRGRFYTYSSHSYVGWPPSQEQIDQSYPLPRTFTPADFQDQSKGRDSAGTQHGDDSLPQHALDDNRRTPSTPSARSPHTTQEGSSAMRIAYVDLARPSGLDLQRYRRFSEQE